MNNLFHMACFMAFPERLTALRKEKGLTQERLAELVGLQKLQIYRYEKGESQPTLDVIKKMAVVLCVTSDELIFEKDERKPDDELLFLFGGVSRLSAEEKKLIKQLIEGIMIKHEARRWSSQS